jgi:transcriptional regulator with XRE-family HTH domain
MESTSLVNYIEKIRYGRNISQEKMLDGIISIRQYRRYLYGTVEIPFGVVAQIASKMGVSANKLLLEFETEKNKERRGILAYYNAVVTKNLESANELLENITLEQIMEKENKLLFLSAKANHEYFSGVIDKAQMISQQKSIVDYPKILNNKILTDSEMHILAIILDGEKQTPTDIIERFEQAFENNELHISGDNAAVNMQLVFWLAKYYGKQKNYIKTIEYCNLGIEKNKEFRTIYLMEYFCYYKALSYKRMGKISEYRNALYQTMLYIEIIPEEGRVERFYQTIKKDLSIDPLEFMRDYININKLR